MTNEKLTELLKIAYRWGLNNGSNRSEKNFNDLLQTEAISQTLHIHDVSSCFYLLSETKPPKNGNYEVLTSRGRVIKAYYEELLGNDIWEAGYEIHQPNEKVLAWRFLK